MTFDEWFHKEYEPADLQIKQCWETKFNLGDFGHCLETVIAWCEIPKFEEK